MFESPWPVADHVLAWTAKITGALAGLAGALALFYKAWRKMREAVEVAGRFAQSVDALELLAANHEKLSSMVHLICVLSEQPYWEADTNGYCTFANLAYQRLTGRSFEELSGAGWAMVIHPDEREKVRSDWQEAARAGRDFYVEFRIVHPATGAIPVKAKAMPIRDGHGHVMEYIGSTSRITQQ